MAEARNSFIKSKMNKDLDARLVPSGEYRDAENVSVSKSEGADVGSLENILGNISLTDFGLSSVSNLDIVGFFMDLTNNSIFVFLTNYVDTSADKISNFAPASATCAIGVYNATNETSNILVQGNFLNFSKCSPVLGVNLVENNLFFTDNRNQPRKINVIRALSNSSYYTTEDQISLAKYYPYEPISLVGSLVYDVEITTADPGDPYIPQDNVPMSGGSGQGLTVNILNPIGDLEVLNPGYGYIDGEEVEFEERVGGTGNTYIVRVEVQSTMQDVVSLRLPNNITPNPYYNPNWPGDENYLKDKFVRFAYRFKFDDGEYSLISPFTQECFVPQQDGYFIDTDYESTYKSTEVEFMQNKINNIKLLIPSPAESATWSSAVNDLKIAEVEVIFKQADQTTLKIVDNILVSDFVNNFSPFLIYEYQSRKPFKTLPESALLRTYDQTPVRALAQEAVGNRIVFGNFVDKHTPPSAINYNVETGFKVPFSGSDPIEYEPVRKEYQNHTLKQNRTYQVGIVLSDKYGRQSDVILSTIDESNTNSELKGSTIFNPYKSGFNQSNFEAEGAPNADASNTFSFFDYDDPPASPLTNNLQNDTDTWPGDQLKVKFNETINSIFDSSLGTPGLYSLENPTGWYSYKIVVKQTETDYYNVYCAGVLNGYIDGEAANPLHASLSEPVGHFAVYSDNLSKIPKDVTLVGPNQNIFKTARPSFEEDPSYYQFTDTNGVKFNVDPYDEEFETLLKTRDRQRDLDSGSRVDNASVSLFTRVINVKLDPTNGSGDYQVISRQYYPGKTAEVVTTIGTGTELGLFAAPGTSFYPYNVAPVFYNFQENPFIAKLNLFSPTTENEMSFYGLQGPSRNSSEYQVELVEVETSGTDYPTEGKNVPVIFPEDISTYNTSAPNQTADYEKFANKGITVDFETTNGNITSNDISLNNIGIKWDLTSIPLGGSITAFAVIVAAGDTTEACIFKVKVTRESTYPANRSDLRETAMKPIFSAFETNPLESKLDIYWETTTSGRISELNNNIITNDTTTPYGFLNVVAVGGGNMVPNNNPLTWNLSETMSIGSEISDPFVIGDYNGNFINTSVTASLVSVHDALGNNVTSKFTLTKLNQFNDDVFMLSTNDYFYYGNNSAVKDVFSVLINVNTLENGAFVDRKLNFVPPPGSGTSQTVLNLSNASPTIAPFSIGSGVIIKEAPSTQTLPNSGDTLIVNRGFNASIITFQGRNGSNQNQANTDNIKDITFSTIDDINAIKTDPIFSDTNNVGTLGQFSIFRAPGSCSYQNDVNVTVKVTDAGGLTTDESNDFDFTIEWTGECD